MKEAKKENRHPLFGTSLTNWIRVLSDNGGVDKGFYLRAIFISLAIFLFLPARLVFRLIYKPKIEKTQIKNPPIFIIGHWRSGTTYLHELISNDPQFAYVSVWYTLVPGGFLVLTGLKKLFSQFLPTKRPMDEIKVDIDSPYEEEAAVAALGSHSFFHCFVFSKNPNHLFRQSMLFEDINEKDMDAWKKNYLHLIKAVTYTNNEKQLILKNPANTARIKVLLELFPDARFIFIYRNPYNVFVSTKKLLNRLQGPFALQNTTDENIKQQVLSNYIDLMNGYFRQKDLIPKGRLVEISFEDLEEHPLEQVKYIYDKLGLSGFDKAEGPIRKHIESQRNYVKNTYKFDKEIIELVDKNWEFTIKKWGYKHPD